MKTNGLVVSATVVYEFQLPDAFVTRMQTLGLCTDTGIYVDCRMAQVVPAPNKEGTLTTFRLTASVGSDYAVPIRKTLEAMHASAVTLLGRFLLGGDQGLSVDEIRRCEEFIRRFGAEVKVQMQEDQK
jgi:hypothetical protein